MPRKGLGMVNIEIHGSENDQYLNALMEVIRKVVSDLGCAEEAIIDPIPSTPRYCATTTPAPYVRVLSTNRKAAEHIAVVLHRRWPAIDIQYTHIDGFIGR